MQLLIFFYILVVHAQIKVSFITEDGATLVNPKWHPNFIVSVVMNGGRIFLRATNHPYTSPLTLIDNLCRYRLNGIFGRARGFYDFCSDDLQFIYREKIYKINVSNGKSTVEKISPMEQIKELLQNRNDNQIDTMIDSVDSSLPYKMDVFIFNDFRRLERHMDVINKNTMEIFDGVKSIFKDSGLPINLRMAGTLGIRDRINFENDENGPLLGFKNVIEPTRFSPFNLSMPLSSSDLIILLTETDTPTTEIRGNKIVHGLSFFGGSTRLDASYSVVFTSPSDSNYFISKKISHEIGHSLGATHHNINSIMEATTCRTCENEERLFSVFSRNQISTFLEKNSKFFISKSHQKYEDDEILKNEKEAIEYADERRKHRFLDIVKNRLKDHIPIEFETEISIFLTVLLYVIAIAVVIFYWK